MNRSMYCLGKRESWCMCFFRALVRLFCMRNFCPFSLPLLMSGIDYGLWLWHSLDFSINVFVHLIIGDGYFSPGLRVIFGYPLKLSLQQWIVTDRYKAVPLLWHINVSLDFAVSLICFFSAMLFQEAGIDVTWVKRLFTCVSAMVCQVISIA